MPTPAIPSVASTAPRAASPNAARDAGGAPGDGFDAMVRSAETRDSRPEPLPARDGARRSGVSKGAEAAKPSNTENVDTAAPPPGGPAATSQSSEVTPTPKGDALTAATTDAAPADKTATDDVALALTDASAPAPTPPAVPALVETDTPSVQAVATQGAAKGVDPAVIAQAASQATAEQAALDAQTDASSVATSDPAQASAETFEAAIAGSRAAPPSNAMGADARADGAGSTGKGEQASDASRDDKTQASAGAAPGPAAIAAKPSDAAAARAATPTAVLAQLLDAAAPSPDAAAPAAGQPAATTTASAPAIAVTAAGQSGLSHVNAQTVVHLAAQITKRLEGRSTQFDMSMTPEGLGRVDVSLDIDADGQLSARLAFDNPLAATDMKGRADELRRQLEDAGFTLAQDALDFSQRDGSAPGGGFDRRQSRAFAQASRTALDADIAAPAQAWMSLTLTPQGVDMKV